MDFQDRIIELRRVPAKELEANPNNWRLHGDQQRTSVLSAMQNIGIADALIAREDVNGNLVLLDGHLRRDLGVGSDQVYPVLVTDLTEAEGDVFLATFDPLTAMATTDEMMLETLISSLWFDADTELQSLLGVVAEDLNLDVGFGDLIHTDDGDKGASTDAIQFTIVIPQHFETLQPLRKDLQEIADKYSLRLKITGLR